MWLSLYRVEFNVDWWSMNMCKYLVQNYNSLLSFHYICQIIFNINKSVNNFKYIIYSTSGISVEKSEEAFHKLYEFYCLFNKKINMRFGQIMQKNILLSTHPTHQPTHPAQFAQKRSASMLAGFPSRFRWYKQVMLVEHEQNIWLYLINEFSFFCN